MEIKIKENFSPKKILFLDPYPKKNYRISKDTSGGYGTANDFGDTIIAKILKKILINNSKWPPMFAAYSFAVLKKNGHEMHYETTLPFNIEIYDIIILISSIVSHETEVKLAKKILKKNSNVKIYAIGPFATNNAENYLRHKIRVIKGEPEFYFLNDFNLESINGDNQIIDYKHTSVLESDLESLPYPEWILMGYDLSKVNNLFGSKKSVPIIATRGCPYSCFSYCVYPLQQGRKVRQRKPISVVNEIKYWKEKHGVTMFVFRDPVFSINRKHTVELCNLLIESKLNINYVIETHLRILDSELINLMKKSGLKGVKVGIENYSEQILKNAKRFTVKVDEQRNKVKELKKNNLMVSAMYIFGFPSDDEDSINQTLNYAIDLNTAYAQFSIWTPYPGTPIFESYKHKIDEKKFESFNQYNLVFKHKKLSKEKMRYLLGKAYSTYYLRPSWLFNYLKLYFK